ncbi:winged helix-turn-helix transcriptional regulator [Streptomyces sp. NPDC051956]|uniref:winged helix-turn-helix transcriptional regulator n=1 Tax=Streptomyces sp. NPDC051956 TaxID=3365677 RepID=UPI0037CDAC3A
MSEPPKAVTVEHTAGGRDLLVTVMTPDFSALSAYIVDTLGAVPGVTSSRAHLITRSYTEGSIWRLRSLTRTQQEALAASRRSAGGAAPYLADHRALVTALGEDGRLPVGELATRLGVSVNTASRRLGRLLDSGRLVLRCDLARPCPAPPSSSRSSGPYRPSISTPRPGSWRSSRKIRLCVGTAGPQNLIATVWLASLLDAQLLEVGLAGKLPTCASPTGPSPCAP